MMHDFRLLGRGSALDLISVQASVCSHRLTCRPSRPHDVTSAKPRIPNTTVAAVWLHHFLFRRAASSASCLLHAWLTTLLPRSLLHEPRGGGAPATRRDSTFSVQCGSHTVFLKAHSPSNAEVTLGLAHGMYACTLSPANHPWATVINLHITPRGKHGITWRYAY